MEQRDVRTALGRLAVLSASTFPSALRFRVSKSRRKGLTIRRRGQIIEIRRARDIIRIARSNVAYASEIANEFDFYFGSARSTIEGDCRVLDMTGPQDQSIHGFSHFPICCPSLVEPWSTVENYLSLARLSPGETVIDLGAYSGLSSIAFSRAVGPGGTVIAVEPDPLNHRAAVINFERHRRAGGNEIVLLNAAASGECGTMAFSCEGTMGSARTSVIGSARGSIQHVTAMTLEQVAAGSPRVDFIKMDIEGAETDVIDGAQPFLREHKPRLLIEPHLIKGRMNTERVCAALHAYGYACDLVTQPGAQQPLISAHHRDRLGRSAVLAV
jgi:FkbM family methyltransferase